MNLGPAEILVILLLALMVFGPKRLPEVGRQVGGAMRELRKVQDTVRAEISSVMAEDPPRATTTPPVAEPDHSDLPPPELPESDPRAGDVPVGEPDTAAPGFRDAPETFS